jgi:hypothetical protein
MRRDFAAFRVFRGFLAGRGVLSARASGRRNCGDRLDGLNNGTPMRRIRRGPGGERQPVMERRRRELRIDGRQQGRGAASRWLDLTPTFRDAFIEGKKPAREADAKIAIQPALKRCSYL